MKWRKLLELSVSSSPPRHKSRAGHSARRQATFEALENRKLFAIDLMEITTAKELDSGDVPVEEISIDSVQLTVMKFDEATDVIVDPAPRAFDDSIVDSEIMMMAFRSNDVVDSPATEGTIADEDLIFYTMSPGPEIETTSIDEPLTVEDVNGDGNVTPLDMLLVINALNGHGFQSENSSFEAVSSTDVNWDINRDGYVTPLDALLLTNYFNSGSTVETTESSQDAFVATELSRISTPTETEDEPIDEGAPSIENVWDDEK
jgi:Dockerin type I domain